VEYCALLVRTGHASLPTKVQALYSRMGTNTLFARSACLLLACALLIVPAAAVVQRFADAHRTVPLHLLASVLLLVPAGLLTLVAAYLLEASFVGWPKSSLRTLRHASASVRLDVLCMAMFLLPYRLPAYVLSLGLLYIIDRHVVQSKNVLTHMLPTWGVQAGCILLLVSFVSYWVHRLEHAIPALWALHKFHHSADRLSIMTAVRQTALTRALDQFVLALFLVLLTEPVAPKPAPGSPWFIIVVVYSLYRTFIRVNQYLVHSNLTTDYGWVGRWLLVSPRMHRLHHATNPEYYNKNFTFDLVLWDRLFGTYAACDAASLGGISLGLDHGPFNSGHSVGAVLRDYFLTTYVVFWRELMKGSAAWLPARPKHAHPDP
jgi:sterol desaturase/sphingolipid hydroxylase (fatty acid hydroxylase superfamily)